MIRVEHKLAGNYVEIKMVEETENSSANLGRFYFPTNKFDTFEAIMKESFPDMQFIEKEPK